MNALIWLIDTVVSVYVWILIAQVVMSWLVSFNIVNPRQPFVRQVGMVLWRLTEPLLGPIRRLLPNMGGIDISPIILILVLHFMRILIINDVLIPLAAGGM
jgi:YggT family protein